MAVQLYITVGEGYFSWQITGLNNPFNTSWYQQAGVTGIPFTDDSTSIELVPTGSEYYEVAPATNDLYWTSSHTVYCNAGQYTLYGYAQAANGKYYNAGYADITVPSAGGGGGSTTSYTLEIYTDDGIGSIDLYIDGIFSEAITNYATRTFTTPTTVSVQAWNGSKQFLRWNVTANGSTIPYTNNPLEYLITTNTVIQAVSGTSGYNITISCNDSNKAVSRIECVNSGTGQSMTVTQATGPQFLLNCTGISTLYAYVNDGYTVDYWYVNDQPVSGTYNQTYNRYEYTYSPNGIQEVNVYANTIATTREWSLEYDFNNYTIHYKTTRHFPGYQLFLYEFQAGDTGTLTVSTSGNIDATMYLSYSKDWNTSDGMPTSYFLQGTTTLITDITTVGQVYYLWVRPNSATATGDLTLNLQIYSAILNDFSAQPVDQTTSVVCSWNVLNMTSGTTIQIRSSADAPSNYLMEGTLQYEGYSLYTNSCTINVQTYGRQYIWINMYSNGIYKNSMTQIVMLKPAPPKTWEWTSTEQTAFDEQGPITALTRDRWNRFVMKINECIAYSDSYNGSSIGAIDNSYTMQSDKIMYATSFSVICQKLNSLCTSNGTSGCGVSSVSKGDRIYGRYFTNMASALNRAINNLL